MKKTKVLCKKDFKHQMSHFKKNVYYYTHDHYDGDSYWIQNNSAFQRFSLSPTHIGTENYPNFYDYFYNKNEIRKLKIMKLQNV
jgi:hypothetical protein